MAADEWARAGHLIRRARVDAGYRHIADFAAVTHLHESTIRDIETARRTNFSVATRSVIESELRWARGSIDRIVAGGDPILVPDPDLQTVNDLWPYLSSDTRANIIAIARSAARRSR